MGVQRPDRSPVMLNGPAMQLYVQAQDACHTGRGGRQAKQELNSRRLASTIGAEQANNLPRRHHAGEIIDCCHIAEAFREPFNLDAMLCCQVSPSLSRLCGSHCARESVHLDGW